MEHVISPPMIFAGLLLLICAWFACLHLVLLSVSGSLGRAEQRSLDAEMVADVGQAARPL